MILDKVNATRAKPAPRRKTIVHRSSSRAQQSAKRVPTGSTPQQVSTGASRASHIPPICKNGRDAIPDTRLAGIAVQSSVSFSRGRNAGRGMTSVPEDRVVGLVCSRTQRLTERCSNGNMPRVHAWSHQMIRWSVRGCEGRQSPRRTRDPACAGRWASSLRKTWLHPRRERETR